MTDTITDNEVIALFHGWAHSPTPKGKGAFVWHKGEIKMVSKSDADIEGFLILDRKVKVRRDSVRLVKVGDLITFKDGLEDILPERCKPGKRKITSMHENGLIGTNKDLDYSDSSAYTHFKAWGRNSINQTVKK